MRRAAVARSLSIRSALPHCSLLMAQLCTLCTDLDECTLSCGGGLAEGLELRLHLAWALRLCAAVQECCEPYHSGASSAPTAEAALRSRFCAFARGKADSTEFICSTFHPDYHVFKYGVATPGECRPRCHRTAHMPASSSCRDWGHDGSIIAVMARACMTPACQAKVSAAAAFPSPYIRPL